MIFFKIYHIYIIFLKKFKKNLIKKIFIGTNSKNCFLKKIKNNYFYSIIKKNFFKTNNVKIFQNNLKLPLTKMIINLKNIIFFKKINGFMIFFNKNLVLSKISFLISNINKKNFYLNKQKKIFFTYVIKNLISKKNYFFKKKILLSKIFSHNDIFKDNILLLGNNIISLIDLNNFIFLNNNNDLSNIVLELSTNYNYKKFFIIENFFKIKKTIVYFINEYIWKIFSSRKNKQFYLKKNKNSISYLKKHFFYENF